MQDLIKNKRVVIICILLLIIFLIIYLFSISDEKLNVSKTEDYQYLKNYSSNEYVPVYVTEEDMVKKYLNEYKNNMLYDVEEAYNSLNKEYRELKFKNIEGYKKYIKDIMSLSLYSIEVNKYSVTSINGNRVFNIYDKHGFQYIVKELSVMNYEIYLDEYTVEIK